MNITTRAGEQFAELSVDEQLFYALPDALPLGWFVLIATTGDVRQERARQRADLAQVALSATTYGGNLTDSIDYLVSMDALSPWRIDAAIEAQLVLQGVDPNPDLHILETDGYL